MIPIRLILIMVSLSGLAAWPALAQFCAADPISPLCCPSPCPVFDATRVPKLLEDAEILGESVGLDGQIVQTASQIGQSIGDAKATATALGQQLSSFAGGISSEVTAVQTGLSTNPTQALATIEQSLFEPPPAGGSAASQSARRLSARVAAAQGEQAASLAASLMRSKSLPSLSAQQTGLSSATSSAPQLQGDMAVNSASRLAIYQDVGAVHQLISAWVAQRSIQSAIAHPGGAGGSFSTMASGGTTASSNVGSSSSGSTAWDVAQLVGLHDARVAAATLLSAYPALQQTVASATQANQFASDAEGALRQSVAALGVSGTTSVPDVEKALLALDNTGWLDSGKTEQAARSASKVLTVLVAAGSGAATGASDGNGTAVAQAMASMTAWLDADKQSRYWAGLGGQARQSMSILDARLGALSDRAGVDVAGNAGKAREKALLVRLSADPAVTQWQALLVSASQDSSASHVLQYVRTP